MTVKLYTFPALDLLRDRKWLDAYKKILLNVIYFGLFIFAGGIYIFPNDSGTQQVFYLLIVSPFLLLFPFVIRELPWKNKFFYIYMVFPLYMILSHSWAPEENVQRGWLFFLRQLICFFVFITSLAIVYKGKPNLIWQLLSFLLVVGGVSVVVSIAQHAYIHGAKFFGYPLYGFSIVDIDKMGAISTIHYAMCLTLLAKALKSPRNWLFMSFLIFMLLVDMTAVYLTKTLGNWIIIALVPFAIVIFSLKNKQISVICGVSLTFGMLVALMTGMFDAIFEVASVNTRIDAAVSAYFQWSEAGVFGLGLTYKMPIELLEADKFLVHPHNMFTDTLRFGGVIAMLLLFIHFLTSAIWCWLKLSSNNINHLLLVIWLVTGIIAATFYGQQPYVRPGSYMWFFYWMPLTLLYACIINKDNNSTYVQIGQNSGSMY